MFSTVVVYVKNLQDRSYLPYMKSLAMNTNASFILLGRAPYNIASIDPVEWHLNNIEAEIELDDVVESLQRENIPASGVLLEYPEHLTLAQVLARQVVEAEADLLILDNTSRHLLLDPALWFTGVRISVLNNDRSAQADPSPPIQKVMVPLDCSLRAECVLPVARQFCQVVQAQLLLAHVVGCTDMPPRLEHDPHIAHLVNEIVEHKRLEGERYLGQIQAALPFESETRLIVNNNVRHALHEIAVQEAVDLVILSAHGSSDNTDWPYGSVTYSFIAHSTLPLLIVPDTVSRGTSPDQVAEVRPGHIA
jgi:nucleotide-binding universal stress UspA family protein